MDKYYHFTKYEYLEQISESGLVPQRGERTISIYDEREAVYLSKEKLSTILMFFSMKWFYESRTGEGGKKSLATAISALEHIDKLLEKEQAKKHRIKFLSRSIDELKKDRESAVTLKNQVENMQKYSSFEEYWGSGVYLSVSGLSDVQHNGYDFNNCWVERPIKPENINVVMLKHKETGNLIDDKNQIIHYLMATTSPSDLFIEYKNTIGINDDKYSAHENMMEFNNYYLEHAKEFETLKKEYELIEVPIKEYMKTNYKNNNEGKGRN